MGPEPPTHENSTTPFPSQSNRLHYPCANSSNPLSLLKVTVQLEDAKEDKEWDRLGQRVSAPLMTWCSWETRASSLERMMSNWVEVGLPEAGANGYDFVWSKYLESEPGQIPCV